MSNRTKRPSPALVVASTALIIALTGTAIAAGVANNSIGASELGRVVHRSDSVEPDLKNTAFAQTKARCRAKEQLLGGGAVIGGNTGIDDADQLAESGPTGTRTWYARAFLGSSPGTELTVTAICLKK